MIVFIIKVIFFVLILENVCYGLFLRLIEVIDEIELEFIEEIFK